MLQITYATPLIKKIQGSAIFEGSEILKILLS
jgi:hypothetical protein